MELENYKASVEALLQEMVTGELRTRMFSLCQDLLLVDGDGEVHDVDAGAWLIVVDANTAVHGQVGQQLFNHLRELHRRWATRPRNDQTSEIFDIRTNKGRIADNVPF